jgi:K+-sensing histidine kinase KdpD
LNKINKISETMSARPNPLMFRGAAYILALCVVGTDKLLGGSWFAFLVALLLVGATSFILPMGAPKNDRRKKILAAMQTLRFSSWRFRLGCAILAIVGASALNEQFGGSILGRGFNIYLIPIFLVSLFFGLPLALLTWLLSFVTAYFLLIPPRYSFEIGSLKDFQDLMMFFYLGLITVAVPALIRASAVVDAPNTREVTQALSNHG